MIDRTRHSPLFFFLHFGPFSKLLIYNLHIFLFYHLFTKYKLEDFFVCIFEDKEMIYPMQQILTTDVKRDVSLCRPSPVPAFILATICTPSKPTHSKLES
jgi:hypothetical protein